MTRKFEQAVDDGEMGRCCCGGGNWVQWVGNDVAWAVDDDTASSGTWFPQTGLARV